MIRYPNYLSIVSIRDDGDFELLATLNGDTIEDDSAWNAVVNTTFQNLKMAKDNVFALNRNDAPDMLNSDHVAIKEHVEL